MSLKFVYALVCSADDCYAEQAALSIYSLRLHNPGCHVTIAADADSMRYLADSRHPAWSSADEHIVVGMPAHLTPMQRSRFIKTSLRQHVSGDFLYLDNDTIVAGSLRGLEDIGADVAAVFNSHNPSSHADSPRVRDYEAMTGRTLDLSRPYFNGGVILAHDTPAAHRLFEEWHRIWNSDRETYGFSFDQLAFFRADERTGGTVQPLPEVYNCQIVEPRALRIFADALIIHYWEYHKQSSFIIFKDAATLRRIRTEGIADDMAAVVGNVKGAYLSRGYFLNEDEYRLYDTPVATLGRRLSGQHPWLNDAVRFFYMMIHPKQWRR